ncbi:MAG: thiamine pyrophosphate-dependent enzyme [Candidatus Thermoplasmatota archaeon]|nr:thiamine pyrophosphate-dependent enzyme [Candidatus Thermoplasmatota archaeon]
MAVEVTMYKSELKPTWCPGCGDFGVLNALLKALKELEIDPKDLVVVSGIGCSSNLPHFLNAYGFHGIHGRLIPVATGIRLANPELTVIATGGDGDGYGIGLGHFVHAMRRNIDITYIVMNNAIYGLTTGQASPTSEKGMITKSTPEGVIEWPVNPVAIALSSGATYISRGFSGDPKHLKELIVGGIQHRGFSLVDVFSPCVTYNKVNTYQWFRERAYSLEEEGHDTMDMIAAYQRAHEWDDRIPLGLFYRTDKPTYEEEDPALREVSLLKQPLGLSEAQGKELLEEFL